MMTGTWFPFARICCSTWYPSTPGSMRSSRISSGFHSFAWAIAALPSSAIAQANEWKPELILLDLMLPGVDGYQVLQQIRAKGNHVPVIILSAKGEEADKVRGFRLDADQYVTKPFGILELLERIAALLRRSMRDIGDTPHT